MTTIGPAKYKEVLKLADDDFTPTQIAHRTGVPLADVKQIVYREAPVALDPRIEHMLTAAAESPQAKVRNLGARLRAAYEQLGKELARERHAGVLKEQEEKLAAELAAVRKQRRAKSAQFQEPQ